MCVFCRAGGGGAAERTDEHGGKGAAAPADVATSQGTNTRRCWTLMWPVFTAGQTFIFALTSHCNFITEARSLILADIRRPSAAQRQLCKLSTSVFCPIRPFSRCTTPWLRRTLTPCCRRCRTTSRRSWRKSR